MWTLPQARKLKDIIGEVRKNYERDLESKDHCKRQVRQQEQFAQWREIEVRACSPCTVFGMLGHL